MWPSVGLLPNVGLGAVRNRLVDFWCVSHCWEFHCLWGRGFSSDAGHPGLSRESHWDATNGPLVEMPSLQVFGESSVNESSELIVTQDVGEERSRGGWKIKVQMSGTERKHRSEDRMIVVLPTDCHTTCVSSPIHARRASFDAHAP